MNELIKVTDSSIGGEARPTVDAADLHAFLQVGRIYSSWINNRITQYGFVEGSDFTYSLTRSGSADKIEKRILLTIEAAKELAMVERNERGRLVRKYFIEVERKYRSATGLEWSAARQQGKLVRKIQTDIIQTFIDYAKGQGSQSADKYFMNFSKMVNTALLEIEGEKPKNLRDALNVIQLNQVAVAESIVTRSIMECIGKQLPYKEIYQIAKKRIETYAQSVGRSRLGQSERQTMGLLA